MPTDMFGPNGATSYYDRWLMQSNDAALHLMRSYSVHPPDNAVGNTNPLGKDMAVATLDGGARDYKAWLETDYAGELEIEDVRPWGAVMGLRDAIGNWNFYLQENASVSYYTLRKKKRTFKKDIMVREKEAPQVVGYQGAVQIDRKRTLARPMRVSEIFPNRVIAARISQPIPRYRTA